MIFQNIFSICLTSFKNDRSTVLSTTKPKKKKFFVIGFVRSYRKIHHLEGLCKTLLLWRCLMEFDFGGPKNRKEIVRRVARSFFFLLKSTTPEDVELLQLLYKELNKNSTLRDMIELRILELLIRNREQTLPRLTSPHYEPQSIQRLEEMWIECAKQIDGIFLKVPEFGISQARPIWSQ